MRSLGETFRLGSLTHCTLLSVQSVCQRDFAPLETPFRSLDHRAGDRTLRAPVSGWLRAKKNHFLPLATSRSHAPRAGTPGSALARLPCCCPSSRCSNLSRSRFGGRIVRLRLLGSPHLFSVTVCLDQPEGGSRQSDALAKYRGAQTAGQRSTALSRHARSVPTFGVSAIRPTLPASGSLKRAIFAGFFKCSVCFTKVAFAKRCAYNLTKCFYYKKMLRIGGTT